MTTWIRWFDEVGMGDLLAVGGKNASLGEMRRALTPLGIRTPDGLPRQRMPTGRFCAPAISNA